MAANTLNRMFQQSVQKFADSPALFRKVEGDYKAVTYREMGAEVCSFACGLMALGVQKGNRIALISENRPAWAISDIAIMHMGAINVAIFPTLPAGQIQYILSDSGSKILIVSNKEQLTKALEVKKTLTDLRIVTMDCSSDAAKQVMTFDEVMKCGEASPLNDKDYEQRWRSVQPDDWASIVYTSGTTGDPKGAILSHDNFASNVKAAQDVLTYQAGDVLLSFVPLNHVLGRLADHYLPLSCGATIAYVQSLRRLRQNIAEMKPHYLILVPRVLDMLQQGLLGNIAKEPLRKQRFFHWALSVGKRRSERMQKKQSVPPLLAWQWWFANRFVFSKIRERLGLQRLKFFICGSAALTVATLEFFYAMGLTILEGYGLTETSALATVNRPQQVRFSTVGQPVKGVKVKIAEDGEILMDGPNVMLGYYNKPKETAEAIDAKGWLQTGDIGEMTEEGFLKITGRKKDILVLANGKKVAPQPIENCLQESSYISQIVLFGDKQSTVTALVVPAFARVRDWAKERNISANFEDNSELVQHPEVIRLVRDEIQQFSGDLADFEKIHRLSLMDHEFTEERGEVTPNLKIKRRVVLEKYKEVIEAMYR